MSSPVAERAGGPTPGGALLRSGVDELRARLSTEDGASAFAAWKDHPVTRLVGNALLGLLVNQPVNAKEPLVQYGLTQGLALARQVMLDPSSVFPGIFDGVAPGVVRSPGAAPAESFGTAVDEAIDML